MTLAWWNTPTAQNGRRRARFLWAIGHHQPWWLTLGTADDQGYTCAGVTHVWPAAQDAKLWQAFARGTGDARLCGEALNTASSAADWLINIAQAFYSTINYQGVASDWDNPRVSPSSARLRWIQEWPWNSARQRWEGDAHQVVPVIPGFAPWAAALVMDQPQKLGEWFLQPGVFPRQTGLRGPWLMAVLLQTLWLQSLRAGYWDIVPIQAETAYE